MVVANSTITDALLTLLDATPVEIGDGEQPAATGWAGAPGTSSFVAYAVLWPVTGGELDGPLGDPDDDAATLYQVTCVGATRRQAETVGDITRAALIGAAPTITGRVVTRITCELGGATADRSVEPAVWITTDRFSVSTTPG